MERLDSLQTHFLAVQNARKTLGNISEVILVLIVHQQRRFKVPGKLPVANLKAK